MTVPRYSYGLPCEDRDVSSVSIRIVQCRSARMRNGSKRRHEDVYRNGIEPYRCRYSVIMKDCAMGPFLNLETAGRLVNLTEVGAISEEFRWRGEVRWIRSADTSWRRHRERSESPSRRRRVETGRLLILRPLHRSPARF
jgi:hypothetical protein